MVKNARGQTVKPVKREHVKEFSSQGLHIVIDGASDMFPLSSLILKETRTEKILGQRPRKY